MMDKKKFHIEYIFDNVSIKSLWDQITTPPGLSPWFADDVVIRDKVYTFRWKKDYQEATKVQELPEEKVRYQWDEDYGSPYYFEFLIRTYELTGATSLEITDFAEPEDLKDSIHLWDSQVEQLKRTLGILV